MKKIILFFLMWCNQIIVFAQQKDYPIQAVPFTQVKLTDNFWLPRIETNRTATIPASFERCENTGRVKNFVMAAEKKGKFCTRYPFDDTDIYKTIEGASFSLAVHPDKILDAYLDSLIQIIGNAQEPDGYLYTARTIDPINVGPWVGKERWQKERDNSHELYNAGHLYEAAAAHFLATGKRNLFDIALKNADLVCSVFGRGRIHVAPGHEIIEMGLVKLYRITGKKEYLETAKFFVEERGHYKGYDSLSKDVWKNGGYWQDDKPIALQSEAIGHAVRAGYLYSAVADVAALTGNDSLLRAVDRIWNNVVEKKMYVQGGIGAVGNGERFGENYELPNGTAYNETCAAIANVYWDHRMFLLHGEARYIDVLEKVLYNGLISGVSLDGKSFFYTNAMQITHGFTHKDIEAGRSGWFECSCCPTNIARMLPSIPGYIYAQKADNLYINLFVSGSAGLKINGKTVNIIQQNNYPWEGELTFMLQPQTRSAFTVMIRVPGWAQNQAIPSSLYNFTTKNDTRPVIKVNGTTIEYNMKNGYAIISRTWKKNDKIEISLPMEIRRVVADEKIKDDKGKIALQRGPLIYCAEGMDNNGKAGNIILPSQKTLTTEFMPGLLNGVTVLRGEMPAVIADKNIVTTVNRPFTAIPYYAWANRGKSEMMIWFPEEVKDVELIAR